MKTHHWARAWATVNTQKRPELQACCRESSVVTHLMTFLKQSEKCYVNNNDYYHHYRVCLLWENPYEHSSLPTDDEVITGFSVRWPEASERNVGLAQCSFWIVSSNHCFFCEGPAHNSQFSPSQSFSSGAPLTYVKATRTKVFPRKVHIPPAPWTFSWIASACLFLPCGHSLQPIPLLTLSRFFSWFFPVK